MHKTLIVVNPSSGARSSSAVGKQLKDMLLEKQLEVKIYETTGKDNFKKLFQDEMAHGLDTVLTLGGDGTISEVINGLSGLEKRPKVLALPLGTANNFTKALDIDQNLDNLLEAIQKNQLVEKEVDIGQLNEQYFISSVSVGSLPEAAWQTDDDLKERLGSFAYILEGTKVLSDFQPFTMEIETEKDTYTLHDVFFTVIALTNSVFGIESFFSEAAIDDGKLHLFALKKSTLLAEAGSMLKQILFRDEKKEDENEGVLVTSFTAAVIRSASELNAAVDGEKGPKFPLHLSVLPKHITFLIPQSEN